MADESVIVEFSNQSGKQASVSTIKGVVVTLAPGATTNQISDTGATWTIKIKKSFISKTTYAFQAPTSTDVSPVTHSIATISNAPGGRHIK